MESTKQINLVMEFIGIKSLEEYLQKQPYKRIAEGEASYIFRQIVKGIQYCHQNGIVHRDIKTENIMIDHNHNIRIIDFGFAISLNPAKRLKIFCGTPHYLAPEIIRNETYSGERADCWSLGILLYIMICGKLPFKGMSSLISFEV